MTSPTFQKNLISILICSKDRRKDLEKLISDLIGIKTTLSYEIIVVEETNETNPIDGVQYIPHPIANRGIPFARNLALAHANGDIIVFLDDDCILTKEWLENLIRPFSDDFVVGIQGGVLVPNFTNSIGWAESILGFPGGGVKRILEAKGMPQDTIHISTLNCSYRKGVIDKIGGFEEELKLGAEDYLLAKQATIYGRCIFQPNALVYHKARGNLVKIWHWFVRRGRAEIRLIKMKKQDNTTYLSVLKSSILLKITSLLVIGLLFLDWASLLLSISLVFFFLLQYFRFYQVWRKSDALLNAFFIIPVVKITMDIAMDFGRLKGLLFD
jgi:GT2 family glycosyltransferase